MEGHLLINSTDLLGERSFPGGYFVRRPPFSWGGIPKPLISNRAKTDQDCNLPSFLGSSSS
jgi:hypothetical protein